MVPQDNAAYLSWRISCTVLTAKFFLTPSLQQSRWTMPKSVFGQLMVFVLLIVAANFILPKIGIPWHISIIGSLVLTAIIWIVMSLMRGKS